MSVCMFVCVYVVYLIIDFCYNQNKYEHTYTIIHTYIHIYVYGNLCMCATFHCTFSWLDSQRLMQIHHDRFGGFTQNAIALSCQGYWGLHSTSQYPIESEKDEPKAMSSSGGK